MEVLGKEALVVEMAKMVEKVALHHCIHYNYMKRKTAHRSALHGVLCTPTCTKSHGHRMYSLHH